MGDVRGTSAARVWMYIALDIASGATWAKREQSYYNTRVCVAVGRDSQECAERKRTQAHKTSTRSKHTDVKIARTHELRDFQESKQRAKMNSERRSPADKLHTYN